MRLASADSEHALPVLNERDVLASMLPLASARVLELGCGNAEKTRMLAQDLGVTEVVAAEVDPLAHAKNLREHSAPNMTFKAYGAESIAEPDAAFDIVLLFKSLHHVPVAELDLALREIERVLKPGGLAYVSEPVFAGAFNEVLRLFHDEQAVRREAFLALKRAVDSEVFELAEERFFLTPVNFASFAEFEHQVIQATHTHHRLSPDLLAEVRARFESHRSDQGYAFTIPIRVDLLRKP